MGIAQNPGALIFQAPKKSQVMVTTSGTIITVTAPASPTLPADYALATLTVSVETKVALDTRPRTDRAGVG